MIKNIIFDMGGVLLKYDPDMFIDRVGIKDKNDAALIKKEIYHSLEWSMMDRGSLTEEEACKIFEARVPEHLKDKIKKLTCEWDRPIVPIEGAKETIKELKENGYHIYLLSNASYNQKTYWPNIPGSEYFDATVISSYIKLVKPQPEIYKYVLNKYNLKADECVFIDDFPLNVEGAVYSGLHGIVFHGNYKEIRKELIKLGVKISE